MAQGAIKTIVTNKGFGFITGDDGNDIFFHRSTVENTDFDTLRVGDQVTYSVGQDDRGKGPRAEHVAPVIRPEQ